MIAGPAPCSARAPRRLDDHAPVDLGLDQAALDPPLERLEDERLASSMSSSRPCPSTSRDVVDSTASPWSTIHWIASVISSSRGPRG
jgi:hypothetical protein